MDKLKVISVQKELIRRRFGLFSVKEFARIFKVKEKTARAFLSYNSKRGIFTRIKRGAYIYTANPPIKFEIANYLLRPSYISFETALSYHGVIPETVYTITSATTRATKEFDIQHQLYKFYQIKKRLFFGYKLIKIRNSTVLMADKEKALLDYLYLLSLKKQPLNERLDVTKINKRKLGRYVNFFVKNLRKNKGLIKLIKKINI